MNIRRHGLVNKMNLKNQETRIEELEKEIQLIKETIGAVPKQDKEIMFLDELRQLINAYSFESKVNLPDFLVAEMMLNMLKAVEQAVKSGEAFREF